MQTITIYGTSDDLVEVTGSVPGCNEFTIIDAPLFIELGCGDVFRAEYTDQGVWSVTPVEGRANPTTAVTVVPHGPGDEPEPYTDTVTVAAPDIGWVEAWKVYPPTPDEMREKIGRTMGSGDDFDHDHVLTDDEVLAVWGIVAPALRRWRAAKA